ncbi:MAG: phosphoesterase, partial [Candidatus Cloacimonetes bacterium]|nr:phosphoesterase [Candidatus Cloacimonadota bacterium]
MAKADLHCHSVFSEHPSEWFLQRIGAAESYTEPEYIFKEQLKRGMDFVTITDHNRIGGVLLLKEKYPDRIITGVESTVYFPEDGCKIHLLVYGLNEAQFNEIQKIRKDIYQTRDYIKEQNLAYSVAHATYSVNGRLQADHLRKLLLLFDNFEGINGGRNHLNNVGWMNVLTNLTPSHIDKLYQRYRIEPFSDNSWTKGITGGSDDHAGLFLGRTYTEALANTPEEFLQKIREKKIICDGRHNDYQSLAFTIYKIAIDYSKTKSTEFSKTIMSQLTDFLVDNKTLSWKYRLKVRKSEEQDINSRLKTAFAELTNALKKENKIDKRFDLFYEKISDITDLFFTSLFESTTKELAQGNFVKMIRNVSSSLPGFFLTLPFFTTLQHMHRNRELIEQ